MPHPLWHNALVLERDNCHATPAVTQGLGIEQREIIIEPHLLWHSALVLAEKDNLSCHTCYDTMLIALVLDRECSGVN
jgi:hypothetical protein